MTFVYLINQCMMYGCVTCSNAHLWYLHCSHCNRLAKGMNLMLFGLATANLILKRYFSLWEVLKNH